MSDSTNDRIIVGVPDHRLYREITTIRDEPARIVMELATGRRFVCRHPRRDTSANLWVREDSAGAPGA